MINSQSSIYYLTRRDTETVKRDSVSSEGYRVWTPSSCTSESESSYSDSAESNAQVQLPLDTSIKNGLCSSDPNEKPPHSYIALIFMAILSKPNKKILLNDIYRFIMNNFPFYNNKQKAWRNNIRHNLSLNECFMKSGRSDNGKGNYWSIHPACIEDLAKGDFRRRHARRRARKNSIKTVNGSSNENNCQNNLRYVPMTSSQIGFHPYSVHINSLNPYPIIQSPESTFATTRTQFPAAMQSFGSDSLFPFAPSATVELSFNVPSTYCASSSFSPNTNSTFYPSCQIQKGFPDW